MNSKTVYVSIGNSDDKLGQSEWSVFVERFEQEMRLHTGRIYGVWYSAPNAAFQNACIAGEVFEHLEPMLRERLSVLATRFEQDSIAWAEAVTTFIAPGEAIPPTQEPLAPAGASKPSTSNGSPVTPEGAVNTSAAPVEGAGG